MTWINKNMTKYKIILQIDDTPEAIRSKLSEAEPEEIETFRENLRDYMKELREHLNELVVAGDEICDEYKDLERILEIVETLDKGAAKETLN